MLTAGTRLGPYEITASLGAGGMGEVYRARDSKLNRDVAIKVLPDLFARDPDRLVRFTREAQTLASLNHPNIAAIDGIESNALVMALVDGDDLSARDGRRVVRDGRDSLWVRDLVTGTKTRIVSDLKTWSGGWLPGDDRIVISSNKTGDWDLDTIRASGGEMTPLLARPRSQHPLAVTPDGSVVFVDQNVTTGNDVMVLSPGGKVSPLADTPFHESQANVSPDGRYVAYVSGQSGRNDVYAVPASGQGERLMVSVDGGTGPAWSRDGRELLYRAGDNLMSVAVRSTTPLVLGERRKLLDVSAFEPRYFHEFDVSPDGQRFLFIRSEPAARPTRLDVIVNWFPELTRLATGQPR